MEKTIKNKISICWLRRDLRLSDQAALYHALKGPHPVLLVFIFDPYILDRLSDKQDARVSFIHKQLQKIQEELKSYGSSLHVLHEKPKKAFQELQRKYQVAEVYTNHDYEPYAIARDQEIQQLLEDSGISFHTFKDQVIFEKDEILKSDGDPYVVFTPYSRRWKEKFYSMSIPDYGTDNYTDNFVKMDPLDLPSLSEIGFEETEIPFEEPSLSPEILKNYDKDRDFPARDGTTHIGVHLRFGTRSIRKIARKAKRYNETFLDELIWREFYMMILYFFPNVVDHNFRRKYDRVQWRNNEKDFDKWCKGETGYPLVDAGMRQLNETGWMHNRVRMVTASFLSKHLLIDWRWGEAYFAVKLLDYELSSNNGNWQWAAGTGCDAAPYFRIFNPESQLKKFDPDLKYVKTWIPEYKPGYLSPVVEHKEARERALRTYKAALGS